MERIAFLGLGKMGTEMAKNLLKNGFPLMIYNRTREKAEPLETLGARAARTPRETAVDADVIVSMVSDDIASRGVWLGENGALASVHSGALLIESSSLSVSWARELAGIAKERGCAFVDAPVRGGPSQAQAAQLNFLVGGEPAAFERARPILSVMGATISHLGAAGNGAGMKLINNMMVAVEVELFEEALVLAECIGLDVQQAATQISDGAPGSRAIQGRMQEILKKDFSSRFALRLMHKDMSYALDESVRYGIPLPTVAASREVYRIAIARGMGDWDFAGVGEALKT